MEKRTIKALSNVVNKLQAVKLVKGLTGYGLKEAKEVVDFITQHGLQTEISISDKNNYHEINNYIFELKDLNILVGDDREENLDELLMDFLVFKPGVFKYKVFEGSYELKNNMLIVKITRGKYVQTDFTEKELENVTVKLDFRTVLIEDYNG